MVRSKSRASSRKVRVAQPSALDSFRLRFFRIAVVLVIIGMLANLALAYYIQAMKERNYALIPAELRGKCFDGAVGGASCGAVQTSTYAWTFGVSNPYYGYVGFALVPILLAVLLWAVSRRKKIVVPLIKTVATLLVAGSAFSLWLLYAQFFLIQQSCTYCLVVDGIMLVATALFLVVTWPALESA